MSTLSPEMVERIAKQIIDAIGGLREDLTEFQKGVQSLAPRNPVRGKPFYTVGEAAKLLNAHQETVRRWIRSGTLLASKTGNGSAKSHYVIDAADIEQFMRNNDAKPYALSVPQAGDGE